MHKDKYYTHIDEMPLYNWRKCQEHGEFEYCRKDFEKPEPTIKARRWVKWVTSLFVKRKDVKFEFTEEQDARAWVLIYDSYLAEFGLGNEYKEILNLKKKIALINCDLALGAPKALQNKRTIFELRLRDIMEAPKDGGGMDSCITAIENWTKRGLDQRNTTVKRFYKILDDYQVWVLAQRKPTK